MTRFYDPGGEEHGIPTYPKRLAPEGLATRRQLRARGLRPAGQDVAAQILWHGRRDPRTRTRPVRVAYLYRVELARPVRPMTPGRWRAVHAMMRARRTCPDCQATYDFVLPTSLGCCPGCADDPVASAA
ncbi:RRQRL motif-containing zinc-binding protein, partial [Streptomyces sp. NPDC058287]|uniref:RRQRL motif-containing zinc-binding protein n=1 Tax=Streptomyces sp. NPDC058287 TaxID=3346423 RepID=UPI0036E4D400